MKILAFAASARKDSLNKKLIRAAGELIKATSGMELDLADFHEFDMPMYDGDVEEASDIPPGGQEFIKRIQSAGAIAISTPEYNGSIPGALKNAIDWASRAEKNPFEGKPLLLIGASPGALGSIRGLWHTKHTFDVLGSYVFPGMFGLGKAHQAFDPNGKLIDAKSQSQLENTVKNFLKFATTFR